MQLDFTIDDRIGEVTLKWDFWRISTILFQWYVIVRNSGRDSQDFMVVQHDEDHDENWVASW